MRKNQLLSKARLATASVPIPGLGESVTVRELTRAEARDVRLVEGGALEIERVMIAHGMTDPKMTLEEVAEWQAMAGEDELIAVSNEIGRLSGMLKESAKEAYKELEADPEAEFRNVPGGKTADDSGETAGGNAAV